MGGRKGFAKIEGSARARDDECVRWDDLDLRSATPSLSSSLSIEFGIPDGLSHSNLSLAGRRPATGRAAADAAANESRRGEEGGRVGSSKNNWPFGPFLL